MLEMVREEWSPSDQAWILTLQFNGYRMAIMLRQHAPWEEISAQLHRLAQFAQPNET